MQSFTLLFTRLSRPPLRRCLTPSRTHVALPPQVTDDEKATEVRSNVSGANEEEREREAVVAHTSLQGGTPECAGKGLPQRTRITIATYLALGTFKESGRTWAARGYNFAS